MSDFKFTLISAFAFIIIVGLGVLAFFALEPGSNNGSRQLIRDLETELEQKDDALQDALRRIAELESDNKQLVQGGGDDVNQNIKDDDTDDVAADAPLLASLKALRSRVVLLEPGDSGTDVGTIQKFLNEYEGASGGVDNDFGPTTRKRVEAFQKAEGLVADGGVGTGTLGKMISWFENNS